MVIFAVYVMESAQVSLHTTITSAPSVRQSGFLHGAPGHMKRPRHISSFHPASRFIFLLTRRPSGITATRNQNSTTQAPKAVPKPLPLSASTPSCQASKNQDISIYLNGTSHSSLGPALASRNPRGPRLLSHRVHHSLHLPCVPAAVRPLCEAGLPAMHTRPGGSNICHGPDGP